MRSSGASLGQDLLALLALCVTPHPDSLNKYHRSKVLNWTVQAESADNGLWVSSTIDNPDYPHIHPVSKVRCSLCLLFLLCVLFLPKSCLMLEAGKQTESLASPFVHHRRNQEHLFTA